SVCRGQLDVLVLEADLDDVVAVPVQIVEGQVVGDRRTFLALVLRGQRRGRSGRQDNRVLLRAIGIGVTIAKGERRRIVEGLFVREQQFVEPVVRAVLPTRVEAVVVVYRVDAGRRGDRAAAIVGLVFP